MSASSGPFLLNIGEKSAFRLQFPTASVSHSLKMCTCLKSFIKEMVQHTLKSDLQPHTKPVVLRFLKGSAAPLSCQTAPSVEPDTHEQLRANSGHNSHASSAVCWNGAQREIKWIRLFQDDRLPCCPGPISCNSPSSQSLHAAESFPGDCLSKSTIQWVDPQWIPQFISVIWSNSCFCCVRSQYIRVLLNTVTVLNLQDFKLV